MPRTIISKQQQREAGRHRFELEQVCFKAGLLGLADGACCSSPGMLHPLAHLIRMSALFLRREALSSCWLHACRSGNMDYLLTLGATLAVIGSSWPVWATYCSSSQALPFLRGMNQEVRSYSYCSHWLAGLVGNEPRLNQEERSQALVTRCELLVKSLPKLKLSLAFPVTQTPKSPFPSSVLVTRQDNSLSYVALITWLAIISPSLPVGKLAAKPPADLSLWRRWKFHRLHSLAKCKGQQQCFGLEPWPA